MHRILVFAILTVLVSPALLPADSLRYGADLSDGLAPIRIADLLADADSYVDEKVRVVGLVEDVCPARGCWVDILEEQSSAVIRFKVEDDVIVFPAEARGKQIVAEGTLTRRKLSRDEAVAWLSHLADEKGEEFSEESVTGPMTIYQIAGDGAEIEG